SRNRWTRLLVHTGAPSAVTPVAAGPGGRARFLTRLSGRYTATLSPSGYLPATTTFTVSGCGQKPLTNRTFVPRCRGGIEGCVRHALVCSSEPWGADSRSAHHGHCGLRESSVKGDVRRSCRALCGFLRPTIRVCPDARAAPAGDL